MAITCGFFNSLNGDRDYNADQISLYFEGLVGGTGVYESVGGGLQVLADSGLSVNVQTGKAIIGNKWVKLDAVEPLSINTAHVTLNRYTAVVLELNITNREITLKTVDGTPATTPTKPSIVNTSTIKQICLAYVYVAAGASNITQANITDTRANTNICGWITGLVNQVNTSTLFLQWQNAYEQFYAQMETWKDTQESTFEAWEASQKAAFESWFEDLTEELRVDTYIAQFDKTVTLTESSSREIVLDMTGYTYAESDVFFVALNGLVGEAGEDYMIMYNISENIPYVVLMSPTFAGVVDIKVLKSKIGWSQT